ncbi:acyl-[ACP]--phospholipid O-acyltransferase [Saccharobesus litoralis]|uniref:Acyl-[ACP]--phospholipid O-acyltransferase n=2 Tax=Saccharobesus litoralis TaxID=2172099 RepID=A0A2S0VY34_9ALTE|nr:acyl-[ACP]--phospholipid O-acyltransferase [Saccharobesus litoralis]
MPFLLIAFLNAFVDLGHKILIQNTIFKTYQDDTQVILTAVVNGLILLPFVLLFSPSGFLADRFAKTKVMRCSALFAVGATSLITVFYYLGWFKSAFVMTLALAVQSAIYSPAKYGYIRELVGIEKLAQGNAWLQGVTIVAILAGTLAFSAGFEALLITNTSSPEQVLRQIAPLGWLLIGLSVFEYGLTCLLPKKNHGDRQQKFAIKPYAKGQYLKRNLAFITSSKAIWLSIVGLAIFWAVCQVMLAVFPAYIKSQLLIDNTVLIQGLLACSGIGIVLGSIIAGKVSKNHIELGLVPVGAIGVFVGLYLLPSLTSPWLIALDFMVIGVAGGLFIVPLNSLIQFSAPKKQLGLVLAGNNWIQNVAMLVFLLVTSVLATQGIYSSEVFFGLASIALLGCVYTIYQLPQSLIRVVMAAVFTRRYRVVVTGLDNLPAQGGVLLLGNHISWIDWAMLQIACPRPVRFVMLRSYYERWYIKPIAKLFGAIAISSGRSKGALREVSLSLQNGEVVCLFPEGAISRNGQLAQFKTGFERAVLDENGQHVNATIVPFYLRGLWGSWLSKAGSRLLENLIPQSLLPVKKGVLQTKGLKRDVTVAFGAPLAIDTKAQQVKQIVSELSIDAWQQYTTELDPVPLAWLKAAKQNLSQTSVIDVSGSQLSNSKMMAATLAFANKIRQFSQSQSGLQQNVGLILPASAGAAIANMAVMLNGQTAVNLNYTSSIDSLIACSQRADIQTIVTSRKFVSKLEQRGIDITPLLTQVRVLFMEDIKAQLSSLTMLAYLGAAYILPATWLYRLFGRVSRLPAPAQILFSSGSEGTPKGVQLSHQNIMANIKQISEVLNTQSDDRVMANLPPFHSFGLTVTQLMPLVEGLTAICHPDPTDALANAKMIAKHQATLLCGTATFLRLYSRNKKVQPLMLQSLRTVVAGAEKLSDDVRVSFESKFNKTIYEGYGATETTPVASVNVPDKLDLDTFRPQVGQKVGTVGLPLPGSCFRIVDPDTLQTLAQGQDGLILIAGGQVMLGYLKDASKTSQVLVELDGRTWYKTGDKGHLDPDGFLTIVDRYSRFAKIGGEMISLGAVEQMVKQIINNSEVEIAAVSVKDAKKGEKVVLLTTESNDTLDIRQRLVQAKVNPLMIPSHVYQVFAIPKLGSGKINFTEVKKLSAELSV